MSGLSVDVMSEESVKSAIAQVVIGYGVIDAVIHAPALSKGGLRRKLNIGVPARSKPAHEQLP
jgi:hypothetical protein